jgi:hypothetical protein
MAAPVPEIMDGSLQIRLVIELQCDRSFLSHSCAELASHLKLYVSS